ncbi:MAG: hypothetical protein R3D63_04580 [Paracoccaceae bacterium]
MFRRLFCAAIAVFCLAQPPLADEAGLARQAQAAFAAGQVELARMLALAVLDGDSRDPTALAVLAAVGLATHEPEAAREVAGRSFGEAADDRGRFTAARLAARASVDLEEFGVAKYWLRRAVQVAPDEAAKAATVRDFLAVRALSPLRLDFGLSIKPSDNVNQGSEDSLLTVDGNPTWFYFDPSSLALPGVEATANLALRYRIASDAGATTEIGFRGSHRAVALSDEAKALAPGAKGEDFATSAFDLFVQQRRELSPEMVLIGGLTFGKTWLAGMPYADRARMELALGTRHGANDQSRLGLSVERQWLESGRPQATSVSLDAGWQHRLAGGDLVALRLEMGQTVSDDPNQENRKLGASLRYALADPVAGATVSAALNVTARDYPVFFNGIFNDTGREDLSVSMNIDLALPRLGAFGFEPVVSLEASRTESNVSRYSGEAVGIGLRIQSSF